MTCNWDYALRDIQHRECGLCLYGGQEPHPACEEHRKPSLLDERWLWEERWWE